MRLHASRVILCIALLLAPAVAGAQGTSVAFGGLRQDSSLPIEVTADQLQIDQAAGTAVFTGNVVAGQGEMRLSGDKIEVTYANSTGNATGQVSSMVATGNVVLVNGAEAAEAQKAVYTIDASSIVLTGNVLLTQGQNALSGERLVVDLDTGIGNMQGRVKTIFQTGKSK